MVSGRSRRDWQAFVAAAGEQPLDRELLHRFLIGVHRRGEALYAHDFKTLLEEASLPSDTQEELISFVEPALALLRAYDRVLIEDEDVFSFDEVMGPGPGDLIL